MRSDILARGHTHVPSPIGALTLVAGPLGLRGVFMAEHRRRPATASFGPRLTPEDDPALAGAATQLQEYFAGERQLFTVDLDPVGSQFARGVWAKLQTIPYGTTWSYRTLAEAMGGAALVRAVAGANARNPLSVVVPCHRVVGSDGHLTGYAGGLQRKRYLLDLEARRQPTGLW